MSSSTMGSTAYRRCLLQCHVCFVLFSLIFLIVIISPVTADRLLRVESSFGLQLHSEILSKSNRAYSFIEPHVSMKTRSIKIIDLHEQSIQPNINFSILNEEAMLPDSLRRYHNATNLNDVICIISLFSPQIGSLVAPDEGAQLILSAGEKKVLSYQEVMLGMEEEKENIVSNNIDRNSEKSYKKIEVICNENRTIGLSTFQGHVMRNQHPSKDEVKIDDFRLKKHESEQVNTTNMNYERDGRNATDNLMGSTVTWTVLKEGILPEGEQEGYFIWTTTPSINRAIVLSDIFNLLNTDGLLPLLKHQIIFPAVEWSDSSLGTDSNFKFLPIGASGTFGSEKERKNKMNFLREMSVRVVGVKQK